MDRFKGFTRRRERPEDPSSVYDVVRRGRPYLTAFMCLLREDRFRQAALDALKAESALPPHVFQFLEGKSWIVFPQGRVLGETFALLTLIVTIRWSEDVVFIALSTDEAGQLTHEIKARGQTNPQSLPVDANRQLSQAAAATVEVVKLAVEKVAKEHE